jgi:hypothetical protein
MKENKEIIFVQEYQLHPFLIKLAYELKKKGYIISSITSQKSKEDIQSIFDNSYYFIDGENIQLSTYINRFLSYLKFILTLRKIKKCIAIGVTSTSNRFVKLIFLLLSGKKNCRIYFPYDIAYLRYNDYKKYSWYTRFSEKFNFRICDGIIHKGPKNELKYLPDNFHALKKPNLQFLPYCCDDLFVNVDNGFFKNKYSKKDEGIHLVFAGSIHLNHSGYESELKIFEELAKQQLYVDIYALNYNKIKDAKEYKKLQKNKYLKLCKPIYEKEFQKVLSRYDWGLLIHHHDISFMRRLWDKTAYSNRISSYLEAGIPTIVNHQLEFNSNIVKNLGIGIVVDSEKNVLEMIKKSNYEKLLKNIIKQREFFSLSKNIDRFINFIQTCNKNN